MKSGSKFENNETFKPASFLNVFSKGYKFPSGEPLTPERVRYHAPMLDRWIDRGYMSLDRLVSIIKRCSDLVELETFIVSATRLVSHCRSHEEFEQLSEEIESIKKNLGLVDVAVLSKSLEIKIEELSSKKK